jgi:hypothetical protein
MLMFFSGGENNEHIKKILAGGAKNILLSYYYIRQKRIQNPVAFELATPDMKFMIDSGAHTIQQGDVSGGNPERFYTKYCEEYLAWALKNKDKIFSVVELDIEESTSLALVKKLQTRLFEPFEKETGIPVIYVWHKERGYDGWEDMCKRHKMVGLPDDIPGERFRQFIKIASKYGAKVHGFAMTKPDILMKAPFYTVDSTRWLTGEQYGCLFIWWKRTLIELRKDDKQYRKRYKTYFERIGCDWKKIEAEDNYEVGKANVIAWLECEKYINERTKSQQWWEKKDSHMTVKELLPEAQKKKPDTVSDTSDQVEPEEVVPPKTEIASNGMEIPETGLAVGRNRPPLLDDADRSMAMDLHSQQHIETSLVCNNCYAKNTCPKFAAGSMCTLIPTFKRFPTTNPHDCVRKIKEMIETLETRANRNLYFEQLDGGVADKNVSAQFQELINYHKLLAELYQDILPQKDKITIEGSQILERIFGPKNIVNVTPSNVKDAELAEEEPQEPESASQEPEETPQNEPQDAETSQDDIDSDFDEKEPQNAKETPQAPIISGPKTENLSFLERMKARKM